MGVWVVFKRSKSIPFMQTKAKEGREERERGEGGREIHRNQKRRKKVKKKVYKCKEVRDQMEETR